MHKNYSTLLVLGLLFISACNYDNASTETKVSEPIQSPQVSKKVVVVKGKVALAIEQALASADFRLLHSKGRRIVVPGLESVELSLLKSQCGLKPMPESSDVIKTAEQRQQQKNQYTFAKQFNQAIYSKCLKNLAKAK